MTKVRTIQCTNRKTFGETCGCLTGKPDEKTIIGEIEVQKGSLLDRILNRSESYEPYIAMTKTMADLYNKLYENTGKYRDKC